MDTKKCTVCKNTFSTTMFHSNKSNKDGFERMCKSCRSKKSKDLYQRNLFTFIVRLKRAQCKRMQLPFNLTAEYLASIWREDCSICGRKLTRDTMTSDSQYAIDRIFPAMGYTQGNVSLLCQRCNRIKYDATSSELLMIGNWLKAIEGSTTIPSGSTHKCVEARNPENSGDDIVCSHG